MKLFFDHLILSMLNISFGLLFLLSLDVGELHRKIIVKY